MEDLFTVIPTKHSSTEQRYVEILHAKLQPNQSVNVGSRDRNSLMHRRKLG